MKVSSKKKLIISNQQKIKKDLINNYGNYCMLGNHYCSSPQLVHIIRQSYSIPLQDNPYNCILGCMDCHKVFDDGTIEDVLSLRGIVNILDMMKKLDERYYNRFICRT